MAHGKPQISIWYFIGLLVLLYGVLILGAGIGDWIAPPANPLILAELHVGIWWGALLLALGILGIGLLGVAVAVLLWRAFCEFYVTIFKISEDLHVLRKSVEAERK